MIAKNFTRYPQAMALQMPLPFGHVLKWNTSRPTTRLERSFRAARSAAFRLLGRTLPVVKPTTPQWFTDAKKAAQSLAATIKNALRKLDFEL